MTMEKKTWLRPTQISKTFPRNKYHFDQHLTDTGDWVETNPLSPKEYDNIQDAAHAWAWFRKYTVKTRSYPTDTGRIMRITLVKKHRNRDYG